MATRGIDRAGLSDAAAHESFYSREEVIHDTPEWKGERFPDGRPKVPDAILDRMKSVTLEEAWAVLRARGYEHQYESGWQALYPDKILVGRALTSTWIPGRLDLQKVIEADGKVEGRKGGPNAWPVDMLQPRDVYVSNHFGLIKDGPSIGDNVANAAPRINHWCNRRKFGHVRRDGGEGERGAEGPHGRGSSVEPAAALNTRRLTTTAWARGRHRQARGNREALQPFDV